ncbi:hypothetical protein GC207_14535 [bacterium]|nr:hypothetical protein [bacterium]
MLTAKKRFPVASIILFGWMPSFLKRWIYRLKGYRIGRNVGFGFGSVICCDQATLGDDCQLGLFSILRGKSLELGDRVQIGAFTFIDTPFVKLGDDTKFNEQVFVGGLQYPDSRFEMGRNCQVMQMTFINPARSIIVGDDTGIGGYCLVFGHTSWSNRFAGYPAEFKPIEIGHGVSVAWRVFICAGAKIGDGAVIGANSLVNRSIPANCLAAGSPATVVARAPYFPRQLDDAARLAIFHEIIDDCLQYLAGCELPCRRDGSLIELVHHARRWGFVHIVTYRLRLDENGALPVDDSSAAAVQTWLSLKRIPEASRQALTQRGILWIDIESRERSNHSNEFGEEMIQFLRRYGVRFTRPDKR